MVFLPIVTGMKAFAFLMGKEIKAVRQDNAELRQLASQINADVQKLKEATPSMNIADYVNSRCSGLVTNCLGTLGNNYNFSKFEFVRYDFPNNLPAAGMGFFKITVTGKTRVELDEYIPVDKTSSYDYSVYIRFLSGNTSASSVSLELTAYTHKKEPLNSDNAKFSIMSGSQSNIWTKRGRTVNPAEFPSGTVFVRPTFTFNTAGVTGESVFAISNMKFRER